jgi:hypothetical protein
VIIAMTFSLFAFDVDLLASCEIEPVRDCLLIASVLVVPIISATDSTTNLHDSGEIGHVVLGIQFKLASIITRHIEPIS